MAADRLRRHLVIFARQPRYGVGKRRLAHDVGNLTALRFSRSALAELVRRLRRDPRWTLWLAVTPDHPTAWVRQGRPIGQGKGDLGERLTHVARALPPGPVVILGADTPGVSVGKAEKKMGQTGSATNTIHFDGARIPAANLMGKENDGFRVAVGELAL